MTFMWKLTWPFYKDRTENTKTTHIKQYQPLRKRCPHKVISHLALLIVWESFLIQVS